MIPVLTQASLRSTWAVTCRPYRPKNSNHIISSVRAASIAKQVLFEVYYFQLV